MKNVYAASLRSKLFKKQVIKSKKIYDRKKTKDTSDNSSAFVPLSEVSRGNKMTAVISEALYKELKQMVKEKRPAVVASTKEMLYNHAERFYKRTLTKDEKASIDRKVEKMF